jgi:hypothetical protein
MWVLTMVFLEVISSSDVLLSSSLGLQLGNLDELKDPEVVKVLLVSHPKFNDSLGLFPTTGVPVLLHGVCEGMLSVFESFEEGMKSDNLVGAGRS